MAGSRKKHSEGEPWVKQGIQLPAHMREKLSELANENGSSFIKIFSTTAIGLLLSAPDDIKHDVISRTAAMAWRGADAVDEAELWREFEGRVARLVQNRRMSEEAPHQKQISEIRERAIISLGRQLEREYRERGIALPSDIDSEFLKNPDEGLDEN